MGPPYHAFEKNYNCLKLLLKRTLYRLGHRFTTLAVKQLSKNDGDRGSNPGHAKTFQIGLY